MFSGPKFVPETLNFTPPDVNMGATPSGSIRVGKPYETAGDEGAKAAEAWTPTWYTPGPKVPTWNYVTVHAYGRPEVVADTQGALDVLTKLSTAYEGADPSSWNLDRLPPGNAEAQTRGIVAFRMPLARLQTKIKLSQNRELEDRHRVIEKLEASDNQDAQVTAQWMKRVLP